MAQNNSNQNNGVKKQEALTKLRMASELYVLMSGFTKMPYVSCDPDTYDDQVLIFWTEEEAKQEAKKLLENKELVSIVKVENKQLLAFYSSLFAMGVNALFVSRGLEGETRIQLDEFVKRPQVDKLPEGQVHVENPEFHLTALYLMQAVRRDPNAAKEEAVKELQEEMLADFQKGRYIVPVEPQKGLPVMKQKDGTIFQPVFTDAAEFAKFNREKRFQAAVVEFVKLGEILAPEAKGVMVNPMGVNVPLQIARKKKEDAKG
ncbi:SseB family protein [Claveliimonas bilis]|uniref:SseB family protein n=1 Tax=Claveliimonas bilis TaxID=3028070 RepID=UPI002931127D|nr:SseB family protein [Claveliimonas bilis]BDZ81064.1 hypothetical protein Lac3_22730 [Claveliimonas bilis]